MPRRAAAVAGSAAATAVCMALAADGVPSWDRRWFERLHALPEGLQYATWLPMQAGALASPLVIGAITALRSRRLGPGARVAVTGAAAWGIAKAMKRVVERPRPNDQVPSVKLRLGSAIHGLGFPSGHAAVAATIGVWLADGRSAPVKVSAAALVGLVGASRVYVGAHYPLDVIGGWALGVFLGELAAAVAR